MARFALFFVLPLAACIGSAPGVVGIAPNLTQPFRLEASQPGANSLLTVDVSGGVGNGTHLALPLTSLTLTIDTASPATLTAFELPIGDVDVPVSALPPSGLALRQVSLGLPAAVAVDVVHAQADAVELHAKTPLRLAWSLLLDNGAVYALGPVPTQPLDVEIHVFGSDGGTTATVTTHCADTCWSIPAIAAMSNGDLYVESTADLTW